jgi:hypothetical protein
MSETEVFPTGDEVLRTILLEQMGLDIGEVERSTFLNSKDFEQMLTRPLAQSRPGAVDPAAFEPIVTGYDDIVLPSRPRMDRALKTFAGSDEYKVAQMINNNKSPSAIRDQYYLVRLEEYKIPFDEAASPKREDDKEKVAEARAYADRIYDLAVPFYDEFIEFETAKKQLTPEAARYAEENPDAGVYRKPITEDSAATKKYRDLGLPTPVDEWKLSDFGEGNGGANAARLNAARRRVNELTAPNQSGTGDVLSNIARQVRQVMSGLTGQGFEGPPEREYFDLEKYYDELADWRNNSISTGQAAAAKAAADGVSPVPDLDSLLGAAPGIGQREARQPTLLANPDAAEMDSRREMAAEAAKAAVESIAGVTGRAAGAARSIAGPDSGGVYPPAFPPVEPFDVETLSDRYQAAADAAMEAIVQADNVGLSGSADRYQAAADAAMRAVRVEDVRGGKDAAAAAGRGRSADGDRYGAAADAAAVGEARDAAGGSRYQGFADELAEIAEIANGRQADSARYGAAAEAYGSRGERADSSRYQDAADMLADAEVRAAGIADGRQADSSRYQAAAVATAEAAAEAARAASGSRYATAAQVAADAAAEAAAAARGQSASSSRYASGAEAAVSAAEAAVEAARLANGSRQQAAADGAAAAATAAAQAAVANREADSSRYASAATAAQAATARGAAGGGRYDAWVDANNQNMVPPTPMDNFRYNGNQVMPNTPMSDFRYDGRQTPPNTSMSDFRYDGRQERANTPMSDFRYDGRQATPNVPMDNFRYNGDQVMPNTSMGNWREAAAKGLPDPSMDNWRYDSKGLGGASATGAAKLSSVPMDNWRYNGQLNIPTSMGNFRDGGAKASLAAAIAAPQPAPRPKMPANVRAALDEYQAAARHKSGQERFARILIDGSRNVGIYGKDSRYAPSPGLNGRGITPLVAAMQSAMGR